jgi:hypothetical protein
MPIDRRRLHEIRLKARAALANHNLSDETRWLYKRALDHAEVALELDSARLRGERRQIGADHEGAAAGDKAGRA